MFPYQANVYKTVICPRINLKHQPGECVLSNVSYLVTGCVWWRKLWRFGSPASSFLLMSLSFWRVGTLCSIMPLLATVNTEPVHQAPLSLLWRQLSTPQLHRFLRRGSRRANVCCGAGRWWGNGGREKSHLGGL